MMYQKRFKSIGFFLLLLVYTITFSTAQANENRIDSEGWNSRIVISYDTDSVRRRGQAV